MTCRTKDNPKYALGAGWIDGELIERLHANFKTRVSTTKRMSPSRRLQCLAVYFCLRNVLLDTVRVLELKHRTLFRRYDKACALLGRQVIYAKGGQVTWTQGEPVDPGGLVMQRSTDDPLTLLDRATQTLHQLQDLCAPLDVSDRQLFELLSLEHTRAELQRELDQTQELDPARRALLHQDTQEKVKRKADLVKKVARLRTALEKAGHQPISEADLDDPDTRIRALRGKILYTVQRIEALQGLYAAAKLKMGLTGEVQECKERAKLSKQLSKQYQDLVKEVSQLNALLPVLAPPADGAAAPLEEVSVDKVIADNHWQVPVLQTIQQPAGVPGSSPPLPAITKGRLAAMDAVFDCARAKEEMVRWAYEVAGLVWGHAFKAVLQVDIATRLREGHPFAATSGLRPNAAVFESCAMGESCGGAEGLNCGRFECAFTRAECREGLAAALVAKAYQHQRVAERAYDELWRNKVRANRLLEGSTELPVSTLYALEVDLHTILATVTSQFDKYDALLNRGTCCTAIRRSWHGVTVHDARSS